jgi:lysophospholipase L1-like esterase
MKPSDAPRAHSAPLVVERLEDRTLLSAFEAHVNFQPSTAPTYAGYVRDSGNTYGSRQGFRYGWNVKNKTFVDRNSAKSPDQRYDTFGSLVVNGQKLRWEISVPNGTYSVHIVGGDPKRTGEVVSIAAEGTRVARGTTTSTQRWIEGTRTITVADGRLTVASSTGKGLGHKLNFIDIVRIQPARATFQAEAYGGSSGGVMTTGGTIDSLDNGEWVRFDNLSFDGTLKSIEVLLGVDREDEGNVIEFRLDGPTGQLIGSLTTQTTGAKSTLMTQFATLAPTTGIHDLFVVFKGDSEVGALDSVAFSTQPIVKVMPLGDSITEARGGFDSYRRNLWDLLVNQDGENIDFVGPRRGVRLNSGDPLHWDFDLDHAGHSGYRADQIRDNVASWAATYDPDIVLLHIGTNDLRQGQGVADAIDEIDEIIDLLRAQNPAIKIVLAQPIPAREDYVTAAEMAQFHAALASLASSKGTSASPIVLIDFDGFDVATHTSDGLHPTAQGEAIMAQEWFEAVQGLLD